jgi:protein-S-isoprenylcysteine O-methyltransferase Ste14
MKRTLILAYGALSYLIFFGTFLYAVGFVGGFLVPTSLDSEPGAPLATALLIDTLLLGVFALQHSLMARPFFKRWLTQLVPPAAERSTYVLCSSLALIGLFAFWQPIGGTVWHVHGVLGQSALYTLFVYGWGMVLVTTFLINHFDLFGLRQVWLYFRGQAYTSLRFVTPGPYQVVRHPLYVGWLFAFWATPTMTVSHLVFALATTAYILIAIQFEERDLLNAHGEDYASYRRRVPMLLPRLSGHGGNPAAARVGQQ